MSLQQISHISVEGLWLICARGLVPGVQLPRRLETFTDGRGLRNAAAEREANWPTRIRDDDGLRALMVEVSSEEPAASSPPVTEALAPPPLPCGVAGGRALDVAVGDSKPPVRDFLGVEVAASGSSEVGAGLFWPVA